MFGRAVLQHDGDDAGQDGHVGAVAASVVHLADVTPASRARAAWETSARIRSVANAVARRLGMSPYRTEFYARDVFGLFGVRTFGPGAIQIAQNCGFPLIFGRFQRAPRASWAR
jgi:hypothetical protein